MYGMISYNNVNELRIADCARVGFRCTSRAAHAQA